MGYGILNAYKIGEVGFKLNEICQDNRNEDQCIASYLNIDSTYEFDLEEEKEKILRQAQVAFSICFSETNTLLDSTTCEDKHNVLEKLRQIAFLDPLDKRFWQAISCIKRQSGLTKHAEFYARLAERLDMSDEEMIHRMIENQNYEQLLRYAISIESLNQVIIPILDDRNTQSRFLIMALRSIEFILPYYEDIPNFEGILTKVIRHDNADVRVFSDVNQIIKDHFSKIPNAENILRYNVNHQNSPPPVSAVFNNLDKLSAPEFFLRTIPDAERSNGAIVQYIFSYIINNYNNTPDAKEISTSLINNDKLKDQGLATMARQLIKNYDQNSDFEEMLQAIIDSPQADLLTINYIIDSLIQNSENFEDFEDFDHFFSTAIHHEKANEFTVARAVKGFIRYYNNPFNRNSVFQSIINNQYVSFACGTAIYTMANNSSPNNPQRYIPTITRIPEKLELIYSHCNNKIDIRHLNDIIDNIIQNTISLENIPNAIELDMLRFILRQNVIDQALLNSIRTFIQRVQVTDEVRIEINQLILEAKSKEF